MKKRACLTTAAFLLVASCSPNLPSTDQASSTARSALAAVEAALVADFQVEKFSTSATSRLEKENGECVYRSAIRQTKTNFASSQSIDLAPLSKALVSVLSDRGFTIRDTLRADSDGTLILTAASKTGLTFEFRSRDDTTIAVTGTVNSSTCDSAELPQEETTIMSDYQHYRDLLEALKTSLNDKFHPAPWTQSREELTTSTAWLAATWRTDTHLGFTGSTPEELLAATNSVLVAHGFPAAPGFDPGSTGWLTISSMDASGAHFTLRSSSSYSEITVTRDL